jgi:hypothetical protein
MRLRERVSKEEIAERVSRRPSREQIVARMRSRGRSEPQQRASRLSGVMETLKRPFEQLASRSREQARRRRRKRVGIAAIGTAVAGLGAWLLSKAGRGEEPSLEPEKGPEATQPAAEGAQAQSSGEQSDGHRTEKEGAAAS